MFNVVYGYNCGDKIVSDIVFMYCIVFVSLVYVVDFVWFVCVNLNDI